MAPAARLRRSSQMRFMFLVTSNHTAPPTPKLMEAMNKLADREIKAGRMLDSGGVGSLGAGAAEWIPRRPLRRLDGPVLGAQEDNCGRTRRVQRQDREAVA